MRRITPWLIVLIAVGMPLWSTPPFGSAGEKAKRVGRVAVDKHEATVEFTDDSAGKKRFHVALSFAKPVEAPGVKLERIKVWLLCKSFRSTLPAMQLYGRMLDGVKFEEPEGGVFRSKAVFSFEAVFSREWMYAVVVAVDDEPKLFKLPPPPK